MPHKKKDLQQLGSSAIQQRLLALSPGAILAGFFNIISSFPKGTYGNPIFYFSAMFLGRSIFGNASNKSSETPVVKE